MLKNKNIFYLEDELILANMIIDELQDLGANCIHTVNYHEAVEKCLQMKYDLIISDIRVIDGTGDELIKLIKSDPKHINYNTPIIVTSGYISGELLESVGDKISVALKKPHSIDALLEAIEENLD